MHLADVEVPVAGGLVVRSGKTKGLSFGQGGDLVAGREWNCPHVWG